MKNIKFNLIFLPAIIFSLISCGESSSTSSESVTNRDETNNQTYAKILQRTADSIFEKVKIEKQNKMERQFPALSAYQPETQKDLIVVGNVMIDYMASLINHSYVRDINKASNFSGTFYYSFGTSSIDFSLAGEFIPASSRALFMADFAVKFGGSGDKQTFYADISYDSSEDKIQTYDMFMDMHGEGELDKSDYVWNYNGETINRLDFEKEDEDLARAKQNFASFTRKLESAQQNSITIEEDIRQYYVDAQKKADQALGNDSGISLTPYENN